MLFSWYYKGFELLRHYLVKHPASVDLEDLDFEARDKEMAVDEVAQASQAAQATVVAPEGSTPKPVKTNGGEAGV